MGENFSLLSRAVRMAYLFANLGSHERVKYHMGRMTPDEVDAHELSLGKILERGAAFWHTVRRRDAMRHRLDAMRHRLGAHAEDDDPVTPVCEQEPTDTDAVRQAGVDEAAPRQNARVAENGSDICLTTDWFQRRELAETKARLLLIDRLDDTQRLDYSRFNRFDVICPSGNVYRIARGWAGNVYVVVDGEAVTRYCIHSQVDLPVADNMLAQKLLLEASEGLFLSLANATPCMPPYEPQVRPRGRLPDMAPAPPAPLPPPEHVHRWPPDGVTIVNDTRTAPAAVWDGGTAVCAEDYAPGEATDDEIVVATPRTGGVGFDTDDALALLVEAASMIMSISELIRPGSRSGGVTLSPPRGPGSLLAWPRL